MQRFTAHLSSICPPGPTGPYLWRSFLGGWHLACATMQVIPACRDLHLLNSGKFLPAHFSSLLVLPNGSSLVCWWLLSCVVSSAKLLIGAHAFAPVVDINVKRNWSQYQPLSNTMSNKPPAVLLTSYYYSLCLTTRTDTHWTFIQPLWSICHQCGYKSIMGHLAKSLLNLHPLLFSCPLIVECNRVCHVWFPSRKSVLVDPKHPSVLHRAGTCFKEDMPYCLPRTGVRLACHFPSFSFLLSLKMHDEICLLQVIKSLPSHCDLSKS